MKLSEYNKKRDFKKTAEPKGKVKKSGEALHFVVQKHEASHLHFDWRLEIDGVLVSWAVPKGPSADPSVKRLAMHVEDHPMDYIDFEGTIPKGQYGGGTVMVWDTGNYMAEGADTVSQSKKLIKKMHDEGNIKIVMLGKKLKGSYHLVRMSGKKEEWLLMKGKDDFANKKNFDQHSVLTGRTLKEIEKDKSSDTWESNKKGAKANSGDKSHILTEADEAESNLSFTAEDLAGAKRRKTFPKEWKPQLATLTDEAFDNNHWLFENKYDGYRALIQINSGKVNLMSRNGLSFNKKYETLVTSFGNIKDDMILDGEIVVEDSKGKSHFQWLQDYEESPGKGKLKSYVFDILYFNGYDLTGLPLLQRKKILKALLPKADDIVYSDHTIGKGGQTLSKIAKNGGEGVIAKKLDSSYHVNKRSKHWLKIKVTKEQEMVIGGYTEPKGTRNGFGSLLIGYYDNGKLMYSGKVGTGFNETSLEELHTTLMKLETTTCPFSEKPKEPNVHWVKPDLVAQIKFTEWTEGGSMRHPVFVALRTDKKAKEVIREKPLKNTKNAEQHNDAGMKDFKSDKVEVTNPDKIFWPKEGYTKGDVIAYYNVMAEYVLKYIKDRPQSLRRNPDGIKNEGFFQKDMAGKVPKWVKTRKLKSSSDGESIEYLICNDKETLIYMANLGCIEINPWSSRIGSINNPDYIIFDLDPNKASLQNLITTAKKVKEVLDKLNIKGYLKTSGGKGLHIFIPVKPNYTYELTREFSHLISQAVQKELPDITSLERMPKKRIGKVYLDFLQNGKGKTMSCAYSLRPREGATCSAPLEWSELDKDFDIKNYNIKTLPERVKQKGDLWDDFFSNAIDLKKVITSLQK